MGSLRNKYQDRIRHARDLPEEMLARGNEEKSWKRMKYLSDHDINLTSGEGGEKEGRW